MSIEKHTRRITGEAQVEAQTKKQATRSSEAPSLGLAKNFGVSRARAGGARTARAVRQSADPAGGHLFT